MHCPTCKHNRETYEDVGPGETWIRCKICHKILDRKPRTGNEAAKQKQFARDIIGAPQNRFEKPWPPAG